MAVRPPSPTMDAQQPIAAVHREAKRKSAETEKVALQALEEKETKRLRNELPWLFSSGELNDMPEEEIKILGNFLKLKEEADVKRKDSPFIQDFEQLKELQEELMKLLPNDVMQYNCIGSGLLQNLIDRGIFISHASEEAKNVVVNFLKDRKIITERPEGHYLFRNALVEFAVRKTTTAAPHVG